MRSADILIETLEQLGTKYIFSLSGNQVMPIYDAWLDSTIELIHVRHEGAAVHMADAWGRLAKTPGVALIAGGPGFANGLSASYVAQMAESPVVILSGHTSLATAGRGDFQEINQVKMAQEVSKAAWLVTDAADIGRSVRRAFALARSGRPGPVHLMLPFDLLEVDVDPTFEIETDEDKQEEAEIDETFIDLIWQTINGAERPLLLAGPAMVRLERFPQIQQTLAEAGLPLIGMESPRGINDPSLALFPTVLKKSDCLLLLGKKIDFTLKFGEPPHISSGTKLIQVDHDDDALELSERNGAHLDIVHLKEGCPAAVLAQLVSQIERGRLRDASWVNEVNAAVAFTPPEWDEWHSTAGEPLYAAEVGRAIQKQLSGSDETIFISDGGEFGQWMQAHVTSKHRVINGLSGSIGNGIPFAIAARLAHPEAKIIACSGDGAFGFHPFEFDTAVRYNIPFTLVVGNDACWNAEYQIQLRNYGQERVGGVTLAQSDYHRVVTAIGGWGEKVTDVAALEEGLRAAERSGKPACLNVYIRGEAAPKL